MKAGWVTKPLGELCRIEIGGTPPRGQSRFWDEKKTTDNVWLSIADMPKKLHARVSSSAEHLSDDGAKRVKVVKAGTLLVSFKLTLGRLAFADIDLRTNEAIASLELMDDSSLNKEYLYWYLTFFDWQKAAEGEDKIKGKTLNKAKLAALPVIVPPLSEQQRIVAILDEAYAGLATATANAEKNLKNAQSLPEAAFAFIFNTGAGQWPVTTIGDQVTLQRGFDITKRQQNTGRVPVVSSGGTKSFHDTAMAKGPGVVLGRKGSLGTVYYVAQDYWPHDTTLWVKDFKGNHPKFVYYFFKSLDLAKLDSGAANPALNRNVVHPLVVNWPDRDRQAEIVEKIEKVSSDAERLGSNYKRSLDSIAALKQSILQKAFSGELTSPPSQAIKEAAE